MPSRARERQLAKLAARRATERRRQRRQRVLAIAVGAAVGLAAIGIGGFAFLRDDEPLRARAAPTPTPGPDEPKGGGGGGCGYKATEGETGKTPSLKPPRLTISKKKDYSATVQTSLGTFTLSLFAKEAPCTVNSFVYLARKGFYDGLTFHRIADSPPVIQGGDPTGTGGGGPGYQFKDELDNDLKYEIGTVAMANAGPNTNGSQFFIVTGKSGTRLPKAYSIFGEVTKGMDVVQKIHSVPTDGPTGETPTKKVRMIEVTIQQS